MALSTGASSTATRWLRAFSRNRPGVAWALTSATLRTCYAQEFCADLQSGDVVLASTEADVVAELVDKGAQAGAWPAFSEWLLGRLAKILPPGREVIPAPVDEIAAADRVVVVLRGATSNCGRGIGAQFTLVVEPVALDWQICGDERGLGVPGWPPTWVDLAGS